jgi:magnesium chelatase subunit D
VSQRYPFSAIVGQQTMKLALVLNAVNPNIGGVLIRGQKGTAKSTAARGLAALLPPLQVVDGCRFGCAPERSSPRCPECQERGYPSDAHAQPAAFVELPVGATEDRVIGTLDVERIVGDGVRHFEPGLLARANRGLLYVDEVNLLPDHLVDTLLDAAAMGVNTVERDGISFSHPAAFVLVGTMNPEEGDLRPQLLDRFGLAVEADGMPEIAERADVVRRRIAFERDPDGFASAWADEESARSDRICSARARLASVVVPDNIVDLIARICTAFEVDGLRADIVTYKTAATLAAYAGREVVTPEDVRQAAELALPHRRRRQPFDQPGLDRQKLDDILDDDSHEDPPPDARPPRADDGPPPPQPPRDPPRSSVQPPSPPGPARAEQDTVFDAAAAPDLHLPRSTPSRRHVDPAGATSRRRATMVAAAHGRHLRGVATPAGPIDILATIRAAALRHSPVRRGVVEPPHANSSQPAGTAANPTGGRPSTAMSEPPKANRPQPEDTAANPAGGRPSTANSELPKGNRLEPPHVAAQGRVSPIPGTPSGHRLALHRPDFRFKLRAAPAGTLTVFVVDASSSMAAQRRMALAKGAILRLLLHAYQTRETVALIAFRGATAELLLPPTSSVQLASTRLRELPTGGRTPLALALHTAASLLHQTTQRHATSSHRLVLISDGRANVPLSPDQDAFADALAAARRLRTSNAEAVMIDTEDGPVRLRRAATLAAELGATYVRLGNP